MEEEGDERGGGISEGEGGAYGWGESHTRSLCRALQGPAGVNFSTSPAAILFAKIRQIYNAINLVRN
jgi:hypothetical protein